MLADQQEAALAPAARPPRARQGSWRHSLYARALLFTLVGSGSLVGAVVVQSSFMIRGAVDQLLKDRLQLARTTGGFIEHILLENAGNLAGAVSTVLAEGPSPEKLRRALSAALPHTVFPEGAFVLDVQGRPLASSNEDSRDLPDQQKLIERVRETGQPAVSALVELHKRPVLIVLAPLTRDGKLLGFAGGVLSAASAHLFGSLGTLQAGTTLELIDLNGSVVASSRSGDEVYIPEHIRALSQAIKERREVRGRCHGCHASAGARQAGAAGPERFEWADGGVIDSSEPLPWKGRRSVDVLAFAPLPTLQMGLAVRQPEDEAFGPAFALERRLVMLGGTFVTLYLIFTGLSVQSVVSPVTRLTSAVRDTERPEAMFEPLPSFGPDEVGELSRAIDRWRSRVVQHEEALGREIESTQRHLSALQSIAEFASRGMDFDEMTGQGLRELLDFLGAPAGALTLRHQGGRSTAQSGIARERAAQLLDESLSLLGTPPVVSACRIEKLEDGLFLASLAAGPELSAACVVANGARVEERQIQSFLHHLIMSAASRLLVEEESLRNQQRREFLHRVLSVQEEERRRIARELHDTVAQDLAAHRLQLERLAARESGLPALKDAEASAHHMLQTLRELLVDLRPSVLDTMGFLPALQWHLERIGREHHIRGRLSAENLERPLPKEMSVILFRIFQEALQNVVLHSRAEHAFVTVRVLEKKLEMVIEDDGIGFDPRSEGRVRPDGHGLGLTGMMERADLLRGIASIDSQPGAGTVVTVRVPWS